MKEEDPVSIVTPQQPRSHVHSLYDLMAASPFTIAPERKNELLALIREHKIELRFIDQGETNFKIGAYFGRIVISLRVCHHFWAAALFFAAVYIERQAGLEAGRTVLDLDAPAVVRIWANYLLSCDRFKSDEPYPFPSTADEVTSREDYVELADELFLGMIAFSFLHEIHHLKSGDSKTAEDGTPLNQSDPHEIEFAADKWAYDWILARWKEHTRDPRVFIKRTLGIIFALSMMDEFRHYHADNATSSHPSAHDRLLRFFKDYDDQIRENDWGPSCTTATYVGLQVVAWSNKYLLPTEGYSDSVEFLNIVKKEAPLLAANAKARRRPEQST